MIPPVEGGTGGANTQTGLKFEREVDLHDLLACTPGYSVRAARNGIGWACLEKMDGGLGGCLDVLLV